MSECVRAYSKVYFFQFLNSCFVDEVDEEDQEENVNDEDENGACDYQDQDEADQGVDMNSSEDGGFAWKIF